MSLVDYAANFPSPPEPEKNPNRNTNDVLRETLVKTRTRLQEVKKEISFYPDSSIQGAVKEIDGIIKDISSILSRT